MSGTSDAGRAPSSSVMRGPSATIALLAALACLGCDGSPSAGGAGREHDRVGADRVSVDRRVALDTGTLARDGGVEFEIGEDTVSLLLTFALEDAEGGLGLTRLRAPTGVVHETRFANDSWMARRFASELVAEPIAGTGDLAVFVPTPAGTTLAPGTWRVELDTDPPDARFAHATAVVRDGVAPATDTPVVVDLHVHALHPDPRYRGEEFATELDRRWRAALDRTLAPHGLAIGTTTASTASVRETTRLAELDDEREIARACRATRRAGHAARRTTAADAVPALHVGLVRTIADVLVESGYADESDGGGEDDSPFDALTGLSPQPGLPFDDESANACVFIAEAPWRAPGADGEALDEDTVIELLAANLLHELGHFASLAHPSEVDGETFDLLDDTPRCTAPDAGTCGVAGGADNLMFHSGDETMLPWTLTADQARVLRIHPLFRPRAAR